MLKLRDNIMKNDISIFNEMRNGGVVLFNLFLRWNFGTLQLIFYFDLEVRWYKLILNFLSQL